MQRVRRHTGDGKYFCAICNEPLKLELAQIDEDGHAVHEECYLDRISGKIPPTVKKPPLRNF